MYLTVFPQLTPRKLSPGGISKGPLWLHIFVLSCSFMFAPPESLLQRDCRGPLETGTLHGAAD